MTHAPTRATVIWWNAHEAPHPFKAHGHPAEGIRPMVRDGVKGFVSAPCVCGGRIYGFPTEAARTLASNAYDLEPWEPDNLEEIQ